MCGFVRGHSSCGLVLLNKSLCTLLGALICFSSCFARGLDFSDWSVFELDQSFEDSFSSGSFDLDYTKIDAAFDQEEIDLVELSLEVDALERKGLLELDSQSLSSDESDISELHVDLKAADRDYKALLGGDFERKVHDDQFLAQQEAELERKKHKESLDKEIFELVSVFDRYQAELSRLEVEREQIGLDFKASVFELLDELELVLAGKRHKLLAEIRSEDLGRIERRDARLELESVRDRLDKISLYQAGSPMPDVLTDEFVDMFEPEVIKPYAEREESIDAQMDIARMQAELAAQNLDRSMARYEADFKPWWSDPALARAKEVRWYKNTRQSVRNARSAHARIAKSYRRRRR